MKNKKALDHIRNTQVGHIQIDYRICCAMINFNFKPCIPDGIDTAKIANRIKKRSSKKYNELEPLLKMRFTSTIKSVDIQSLSDFPKLTLSQIRKRITFGSFKIRQSQSYIPQIIQHSKMYMLQQKHIEKYVSNENLIDFTDTKIFAVLIPSRHKRGKKPEPKNSKTKKLTKKKYLSIKSINDNRKKNEIDPKSFKTYYKVFVQYKPCNDSQKENLMKPYDHLKSIILHFTVSQKRYF